MAGQFGGFVCAWIHMVGSEDETVVVIQVIECGQHPGQKRRLAIAVNQNGPRLRRGAAVCQDVRHVA